MEDVTKRGQKNYSLILQKLASVGQANVADALGVNESTVSRMKDSDIERFSKMLAVLGLKITPIEYRCFPVSKVHAFFTLAKAHMDLMENGDLLSMESE